MKIAECVVSFWCLGCCYGVLCAVGCEKLRLFRSMHLGFGAEKPKKAW